MRTISKYYNKQVNDLPIHIFIFKTHKTIPTLKQSTNKNHRYFQSAKLILPVLPGWRAIVQIGNRAGEILKHTRVHLLQTFF